MTRALVTKLVEALVKSTGELHRYYSRHDDMQLVINHKAIQAAREYLATEPSGERAELIQWLRERSACDGMLQLSEAADMLEADAQEIERTRKMYEKAHQGRADFRQAFREARKAQQAKRVPMTDSEIYSISRLHPRFCTLVPHLEVRDFARAIEAHHGITQADKPTDWSAA